MSTMLLYNPNHLPAGERGGQFAPKGGGAGGGSGRVSAARMARIEKLTAEARVAGGGMTAMTRQCAGCGKLLNGPHAGAKMPLPHSEAWGHGLCPHCAQNEVAVLRAERTGKPLSKTLRAWVNRKHAIKADFEKRAAQYIQDHPTNPQAAERGRAMRLAEVWSRPIRLEETSTDGKHRTWLMFMPLGEFEHPEYGKLQFSEAKLKKFKANFDKRTRKIDIALDADHKATQGDSRATGWVEAMELRPDGLWASVAWTSYGVQLLSEDIYRYFSPEFGDYTDEETGEVFHDVPIGGALTNRPFLKVMPAIKLAEVSTKPWGSVSKSDLPKACFLWVAGPNKADWHLPVYESNGQGGRGALNKNGVKAAYDALHGARTDTPMSVPSSVRAKVVSLYNRLFPAQQATETREGTMARTYQFGAAKTPLRPKAGSSTPPASDVDEYDPGNEDDPTQFDDGEEDASLDDGEDAESYDDTSDDSEMDDGEPDGDEPFGGKKAPPFGKGKQMSRKASTKTASRAGGRKMSETQQMAETRQLRTQLAEMQQQMAEQNYRLYEKDIDEILRSWDSGKTVTFFASELPRVPKGGNAINGKRVERKRTVAMTPAARRGIRDFLLSDGFQLSETRRSHLLDLFQLLLSERAQVDLTRYGNSFDMDTRKTVTLASRRGAALEGAELHEIAESLASQAGKEFATLSLDEKQRYYMLAEREG